MKGRAFDKRWSALPLGLRAQLLFLIPTYVIYLSLLGTREAPAENIAVEDLPSSKEVLSADQIADWCFRFWREREEGSSPGVLDDDLDIAAGVALDVGTQWGIYLLESFTLGELQSMDFSEVRLPAEWFRGWQHERAV